MAIENYDPSFEEQVEILDEARDILYSSAQEFFADPMPENLRRLEVARIISSVAFRDLLEVLLESDDSTPGKVSTLEFLYRDEDSSRVVAINQIAGRKISKFAVVDLDKSRADELSPEELESLFVYFSQANHYNSAHDIKQLFELTPAPEPDIPTQPVDGLPGGYEINLN